MNSRPNRKVKPSAVKSRSRNKSFAVVGVITVIAIIIVAFVLLNQNNTGNPNNSLSPSATSSPSPSTTSLPSASPTATPLTSPVGEYSANGTRVLLQTSMGNITIQMRDDKPITTTNFINLVRHGIYDGTLFHRIISDFMIQGGVNSTAQLSTVADEIGNDNRNVAGTIAMAKTNEANSATSSFFINVVDNGYKQIDQAGTRFDAVYTVFGKVIDGLNVVYAISNVAVQYNVMGELSQPQQTITLINAEILP